MKDLRDWQKRAVKKWVKNDFNGTIEAATGTGKTIVGLHIAIEESKGKVLIVVPTIALQKQWYQELIDVVGKEFVGLIGGGEHYNNEQYVIAVVNSIRSKHFETEYGIKFDLVILDEIHRYFSQRNVQFLFKNEFEKVLGLSATPDRTDSIENSLLHEVAPVVYRYKRKKAIDDGVLSNYSVVFKGVDLSVEESIEYMIYHSHVKDKMKYAYGREFMQFPYQLRRAIMQRRKIVQNAENKVIETLKIIKSHPKHKIIIFTESIDTADEINNNEELSVIYHSKTSKEERDRAIEQFKDGTSPVLVTVRALDEGFNVPNCDMAIFAAGNKTKRQTIQRIGRILRKTRGKHAKIFFMYCKNTIEEAEMKKKEKMFEIDVTQIKWI